MSDYLVGIDVGSSKIGVLIGEPGEESVSVIGKGMAPNRGTRRGNVQNVEQTVEALMQACEEAEVMAGVKISKGYVGFAGSQIKSANSRGSYSMTRSDQQITRRDIRKVLVNSSSASLTKDREILHNIPHEFLVDGRGRVANPEGMLGTQLEIRAHIVTCSSEHANLLRTCLNRAGIEIEELIFEPLAAAEAALQPDEKQAGSLLIDIGSGSTEYALFFGGHMQQGGVLPIGASHFTNDIAMVLRTPFAEAERLKVRYGCCVQDLIDEESSVVVPGVAGGAERLLPTSELVEILQPRAEELLSIVRSELTESGWEEPPSRGVVLTGGGSQLDGFLALAESVFSSKARYGLSQHLLGIIDATSTAWCTAAGLLLYGNRIRKREKISSPRLGTLSLTQTLHSLFDDLL